MEVCSARLDPLQLWASSHQMNIARRRLYDNLEAQLGHTGLMLGGATLLLLPPGCSVTKWMFWLAIHALWHLSPAAILCGLRMYMVRQIRAEED